MLECGLDVCGLKGDAGPHFTSLNDPLAAQAWSDLRIKLLDEFIRQSPGKRPAAAWIFDIYPQHGPRLQTAFDRFGIEPADALRPPQGGDGFESQEEYLRRCGGLETHEFFRLAKRPTKRKGT